MIKVFLIYLLSFTHVYAQNSENAQIFLIDKLSSKYSFEDKEFPKQLKELEEKNKIKEIFIDIDEKLLEKNSLPEYRLILAAYLHNEKQYFTATQVLKELAVEKNGSLLGTAAINLLVSCLQEYIYDEEDIIDFIISNDFVQKTENINSFVNYHLALYNLRAENKKWFKKSLAKIEEGSFWEQKWKYNLILKDYIDNDSDSSIEAIKAFIENPATALFLKNSAILQLARINFERENFEESFKLYTSLPELANRERGRVLLEMAWTKYYLKDYGKALGLLHILKTPYFNPSVNSERYILEGIIYKQLCHYKEVVKTVRRFKKKFGRSFKYIKRRIDLTKDRVLSSMALMNLRYQTRANQVDSIRKEIEFLLEYDLENKEITGVEKKLKERENILRKNLDLEIREEVDQVALELLEAKEQIEFLDYTAKLDSMRVDKYGEARKYDADQISFLNFDKVFWLIKREFWWDEVNDIKVLINSRCYSSTYKVVK